MKVAIGRIECDHANNWIFKRDWKAPQNKSEVEFTLDFKSLRVKIGDKTRDDYRHDIVVKFDNIKRVVKGTHYGEDCK